MKKWLACLMILSGLCIAGKSEAATLKIVALVNGEIISSEDIQNRINAFLLTTQFQSYEQTKDMIAQRVLILAVDEI